MMTYMYSIIKEIEFIALHVIPGKVLLIYHFKISNSLINGNIILLVKL